MNDSLSIIVPIRNGEQTLAGQVARLLDVLPDLTGRFEILVVDDASTDQTIDLVRELAAQYPQIRLIRHREPRGPEAAVRTGLQWANGRVLFVQEDAASLSPTDLRKLWALRNDEELVMARAEARPGVFDDQLLQRLSDWGTTLRSLAKDVGSAGGIHMIRRAALEQLLTDGRTEDDLSIESVSAEPIGRADASHPPAPPRQPATFLRHLRSLALGE
ncbi:MAG: glycosyltransferase family 2 protein [Pirellulaceae bacterium]